MTGHLLRSPPGAAAPSWACDRAAGASIMVPSQVLNVCVFMAVAWMVRVNGEWLVNQFPVF